MKHDQEVLFLVKSAACYDVFLCESYLTFKFTPQTLFVLLIVEIPQLDGLLSDVDKEAAWHQVSIETELFNFWAQGANTYRQL